MERSDSLKGSMLRMASKSSSVSYQGTATGVLMFLIIHQVIPKATSDAMKPLTSMLPTPDELTLDQIQRRFSSDEKARKYLEAIRWPEGPVCAHCGANTGIWSIASNKRRNIRPGLYECSSCKKQFTVTVGTVMEDSHIPLRKWLVAWYLMCSSKKGISALQIQRMLDLGSYRTAHFLMHRIRHGLKETGFKQKFSGIVEVDETYIGGKQERDFLKRTTGFDNKTPVVSLVERKGNKRSMVMARVTSMNLRSAVEENVEAKSVVMTDQSLKYKKLEEKFTHHRVNHGKQEFARKVNDSLTAHSNTVESSFSLLKRGIMGTFHHIGKRHLPLYLAEFDHRWNTKDKTDGQRTIEGIKMAEGKRLVYKQPKDKHSV